MHSGRELSIQADSHTGKDSAKYLGVRRATLYRYLASERAAYASSTPRAGSAGPINPAEPGRRSLVTDLDNCLLCMIECGLLAW